MSAQPHEDSSGPSTQNRYSIEARGLNIAAGDVEVTWEASGPDGGSELSGGGTTGTPLWARAEHGFVLVGLGMDGEASRNHVVSNDAARVPHQEVLRRAISVLETVRGGIEQTRITADLAALDDAGQAQVAALAARLLAVQQKQADALLPSTRRGHPPLGLAAT